ncbi:hypothetical protein ACR78F_14335 [Sphingobacterium spiritivorum]|uniref:hypothetical protein n=1 Tax=Sphingobacterium spiritivorum TaxID=258 RepID=UPI003DA228FD
MRRLFLIFILAFYAFSDAAAQQFIFDKPKAQDFNFDIKKLDSTANAVVLEEIGKTNLILDDIEGRLYVQHEYKVRILILNQEGFQKANFSIRGYKDGSNSERITDIKGITYNIENGLITSTEMDNKKIFKEDYAKYTTLTKFTLPNIKEGSIIDVTYILKSPHIFNFRNWDFQDDIPKVSSTYIGYIPANYTYNILLRGPFQLTDRKAEIMKECIVLSGQRLDCSKLTFIMKNIPAFIEEDFMTAPSNFRSAIYFELSDVIYMNGSKQSFTKKWSDVDRELLSDKKFGGQLKKDELFTDILPEIAPANLSTYEKARNIYEYIKKQIKWNKYYGKYSEEGIKKALETHSGNIGDINLGLIAALNAAQIETYPVILSTRDNGVPNKLFPVVSYFDYVIAKTTIDGVDYLLDASEQMMPFGHLPLRCMNDEGRIILSKKSSDWIPIKSMQRISKNYNFDGELQPNGVLKGKLIISSFETAAYNKRMEIKAVNTLEEYVEKFEEKTPNLTILNSKIEGLETIEDPLWEEYDIEYKMNSANDDKKITFNPNFLNRLTKNPFNLSDRNYPVDLGFARYDTFTYRIKFPEGYKLQDGPKNIALTLPDAAAKFVYKGTYQANEFNFEQIINLTKPVYNVEEYFHLKEFMSRIIQQQKIDYNFAKN